MLALKNKAGIVEGSIPGLADMARLSLEDTMEALQTLRSPDPYSRTKEHEGRRIQDIDGGWLVLNHEKWRKKMSADERRDYLRVKQREHRAKVNKSVNKSKQMSTMSTHTDKEADTETKPFIEQLKSDSFNAGVDIDAELQKAKRWCIRNKRKCTERFFRKWVERADRLVPDPTPKPKTSVHPVVDPDNKPLDESKRVEIAQQMKELAQQFKMP